MTSIEVFRIELRRDERFSNAEVSDKNFSLKSGGGSFTYMIWSVILQFKQTDHNFELHKQMQCTKQHKASQES